MIHYSIIIPHHNIPQLLRRCLYSIPKREDLEIIVIDDGSDQDYIPSLHSLEKEFKEVKFLYQKTSKGGGAARNIGLRHAIGKYVMFADADDFYNYCIQDFLEDYAHETCDMVYFNANSVDTETYLSTKRMEHLNKMHKEYEKAPLKALLQLKYLCGEPSNKLIKREVICNHNILFEETRIHNDTKFSYYTAFHSKDFKIDHRAVYCLTDRAGSVSKNISDDAQLTRTRIFAEKNEFLSRHGIPVFDFIMLWPFRYYISNNNPQKFYECLEIARQHGFNLSFITKKLIETYGIRRSKAYRIPIFAMKRMV